MINLVQLLPAEKAVFRHSYLCLPEASSSPQLTTSLEPRLLASLFTGACPGFFLRNDLQPGFSEEDGRWISSMLLAYPLNSENCHFGQFPLQTVPVPWRFFTGRHLLTFLPEVISHFSASSPHGPFALAGF